LGTYDNLIKSDLASAINSRYSKIIYNTKMNKFMQDLELKKLIEQERVKSLKIGQRIMLQQFCQEK
jgi:polysaccharide pyruvyl transferase WcaK-like protein